MRLRLLTTKYAVGYGILGSAVLRASSDLASRKQNASLHQAGLDNIVEAGKILIQKSYSSQNTVSRPPLNSQPDQVDPITSLITYHPDQPIPLTRLSYHVPVQTKRNNHHNHNVHKLLLHFPMFMPSNTYGSIYTPLSQGFEQTTCYGMSYQDPTYADGAV